MLNKKNLELILDLIKKNWKFTKEKAEKDELINVFVLIVPNKPYNSEA